MQALKVTKLIPSKTKINKSQRINQWIQINRNQTSLHKAQISHQSTQSNLDPILQVSHKRKRVNRTYKLTRNSRRDFWTNIRNWHPIKRPLMNRWEKSIKTWSREQFLGKRFKVLTKSSHPKANHNLNSQQLYRLELISSYLLSII